MLRLVKGLLMVSDLPRMLCRPCHLLRLNRCWKVAISLYRTLLNQSSSFRNTWFYVCDLEISGDIFWPTFIRFIQFTALNLSSPCVLDLNISLCFTALVLELLWH